ncbi:hypothetical protein [Frigoriglobus tundricola]|nr:hypothetical protein [Frigoriglobus tundricola]
MYQYVVNLVPPDLPERATGSRTGVVDAYTRVATEFIGRARQALAERGLTNQVDGFGEAYGLPVVTLTATPSAAAVLETLPGVEAVYRDDNRLGLTT